MAKFNFFPRASAVTVLRRNGGGKEAPRKCASHGRFFVYNRERSSWAFVGLGGNYGYAAESHHKTILLGF
jgi:hypothetical protein